MNLRKDFPFQELIGWQANEMGNGAARFSLEIREAHLSPIGLVHGAVAYTLCDTAMGAALFSSLSQGEYCTTIEISMRYLKGVSDGMLECLAEVTSKTRRLGHCRAVVTLEGQEVAGATGSFLISKFKTDAPTTG